jgi:rhombotail lipoprotein
MRKGIVLLFIAILVTGCASLWHGGNVRQGVSSSLVDYLYPAGEEPPPQDMAVPNLKVPLRVGLAFVPSYDRAMPGLSEARKIELLERVKAEFAERDFIREIVIIPDTYLRSRKGFETIEQTARLYGLDIMALVSYDQVAYIDDNKASILYWTIVGAYFIKGSKNDVQTFVDAAIFDVPTRKLLFRAPGIDRIEATSTLVENDEVMREARARSFDNAMGDMTINLENELDRFRERIKQDKSVTVTEREGYTGGGGAIDMAMILLIGLVLAGTIFTRKRVQE